MANFDQKDIDSIKLRLVYPCLIDVEGLVNQVEILERFGLTNNQQPQVCAAKLQFIQNARPKAKEAK